MHFTLPFLHQSLCCIMSGFASILFCTLGYTHITNRCFHIDIEVYMNTKAFETWCTFGSQSTYNIQTTTSQPQSRVVRQKPPNGILEEYFVWLSPKSSFISTFTLVMYSYTRTEISYYSF